MGLLKSVMNYFTKSKKISGSAVCTSDSEGGKVAAIAAALHHHSLEDGDVRAKVAAIAVALHHHKIEASSQNNGLAGLASLVAAIHHHNKKQI